MDIQVLIADDEPIARDILETYILKIPGLAVAAKCRNALEAFSVLNQQKVDLMLLDINMPEVTGINFIKSLKNPPLVIFTTAYSEYAVESYELNAVDYLLKPISIERFIKAIDKVRVQLQLPAAGGATDAPAASLSGSNLLFVKSEGKLVKIDLSQLWLVEGLKDYLRLWTDAGRIVVHTTMKNFEDQLAAFPMFIRINKSYIININYVSEIDGNAIKVKDQSVVIGSTYKDEIHALFAKMKLF